MNFYVNFATIKLSVKPKLRYRLKSLQLKFTLFRLLIRIYNWGRVEFSHSPFWIRPWARCLLGFERLRVLLDVMIKNTRL